MKFGYQEHSSNSFIRLKDNESIIGVLKGEPFEFRQHWSDNKSSICVGPTCSTCRDGDKPAFRFRIQFIEKGSLTSRILEQGYRLYENLKQLNENGYNLDNTWIKIVREGSGTSTKYMVIPMPNGVLTHTELSTVQNIESTNLKVGMSENVPLFDSKNESDIPF